MTDADEPDPIPETITYTGDNEASVLNWAIDTLNHYEANTAGAEVRASADGSLLTLEDKGTRITTTIPRGDSMTYVEHVGFVQYYGPELLALDHPQTVSEAKRLQEVKTDYGLSLPRPQDMDFVNRRAATEGSALDRSLEGSMDRHPTGRYARSPLGQAGHKPVVTHPPRLV